MATNPLYDPSNSGQNSSKGAMIQANMYAWVAEGLGRVDISSAPNVRFEYEEMQRKDKTRIINPLAHIQFATGLRPVRAIFSEGGVRYTNKVKDTFESVSFPSYTGANKGNPYAEYLIETVPGGTAGTGPVASNGQKISHSKYLLKPKIDSLNLIPQLVSDVTSVAPSTFADSDADTKAEFIRNSYFNFTVGPNGGTVNGRCNGSNSLNTSDDSIFYVYDANNYGDDGSLNVVASFKIYAKYNDDGYTTKTTTYWPKSQAPANAAPASAGVSAVSSSTGTGADDKKYLIDGMPITTFKREVVDVSFIFPLENYYTNAVGSAVQDDGLKLKNNDNTDVSYVGILMHGNVSGFKFISDAVGGGQGDLSANNRQVAGPPNGFICSKLKQSSFGGTTSQFIDAAKAASESLDFSFTGLTLEDTDVLNLNDDNWQGDLILPLTGDAVGNTASNSRTLWNNGNQSNVGNPDKDLRDAGGLQCVHIPDSIRTLRNDAAQSLAANFAGLSELLGSVNITTENDISMGEFNSLAFDPLRDASTNAPSDGAEIDGPAGSEQAAHGVFTIKGDILISKLRNFMLGSNYNGAVYTESGDGFAKQALNENERRQHIHKVVYWCNADQGSTDISKACLARDTNQVIPDVEGGIFTSGYHSIAGASTNTTATGAFLTELTPQESSFFYIYPWATPEMCAISSGSIIGARNIVETSAGSGVYKDGLPDGSTVWNEADGFESRGMTLHATAVNANDFKCNPFRQYQDEYVGGIGYNSAINFDSLSIAVPTVKGWLDNRHGYYNTTKKRTEWYAFADICGNNNHNSVQINDISYVYQALGPAPTGGLGVEHDSGMQSDGKFPGGHAVKPNGAGIAKGAVNKSVLDIVFPDVTNKTGALLSDIKTDVDPSVQEGGDYADDDFCTLNFRVPLEAVQGSSQKRLQKVSNLNNGVVQLANESHVLNSGFTAKVNASAENLSAIAANVNELMNSYCPVILRLMDEDTIGVPGHQDGTVVAGVSETRTVA
jgi:hypothetical protein